MIDRHRGLTHPRRNVLRYVRLRHRKRVAVVGHCWRNRCSVSQKMRQRFLTDSIFLVEGHPQPSQQESCSEFHRIIYTFPLQPSRPSCRRTGTRTPFFSMTAVPALPLSRATINYMRDIIKTNMCSSKWSLHNNGGNTTDNFNFTLFNRVHVL